MAFRRNNVNLLHGESVIPTTGARVPDFGSLADEELALALQKGLDPVEKDRAFEELVRRYQARVYAVAYRIISNREEALDVAQDVFVKAYRKIQSWRPRGQFGSWLMRLTVNQSIDAVRRHKRHRHLPLEDSGTANPVAPQTRQGDRRAAAEEIGNRVQQALNALSVSQRAVFIMRHYDGMPIAEIAKVMGCTTGSVKVHLYRALKKLQVELRDLYAD